MFKLGQGSVIPGWEEGMEGMCVGESRLLVVPPHLAYGKKGAGGVIPPGMTPFALLVSMLIKHNIMCVYFCIFMQFVLWR